MKNDNFWGKYLILFFPWALSLLFKSSPVTSYLIAWIGSFFIFYMVLTGKIKPLPADRNIADQLMRPVFIVQLIFAGYMCCTSIFYFLSILGYEYLSKTSASLAIDQDALALTAQCQRYYCLGHAAFASGILVFMKYPVKRMYYIEKERLASLLLRVALISLPVSMFFTQFSSLLQFYRQISTLSFIAGTLALAFAIPLKKSINTLICLTLYSFNFYNALISGFKEPIIISVLVLGLFLYPSYKRIVTIVFGPVLIALFMLLPTYVNSFRGNVWAGTEIHSATQTALNSAFNKAEEDNTNWIFLVYRLSEIDMFTLYVKSTPKQVGFYGTQLLKQSFFAVIPRVIWPSKPNTEGMVMERVYNAGVISRLSSASAKPQFIVDAYLSGGAIGIFIFLFAYGAVAQVIAIKAEELFGGYIFGTALIFSGLFQIFWRGVTVEFLVNAVFWAYITMLIIFKVLRSQNILKQI